MKKTNTGSLSTEKLQTVSLWLTAIFAAVGFIILSLTNCQAPDEGKTLESIAVTTQPAKIVYAIGDELDTTGMVVTASYSDGTSEAVTGYTLSGFDSATAGQKTVTVTYEEKTADFTVTVNPAITIPDLESIAVTTPPTKTEFNLGEELDTSGMVITAAYSDGTSAAVTGYTVSGYDKDTLGNHTITVSYGGKTAEFTVNVIDPTLPTVAAPTASVAAGTYTAAQSVTLTTTTTGATIYYTLDGEDPTTDSAEYSGAIAINATTTLKAFAVKADWNDSDILTAVYTLTLPTVATPTANPAAGTYNAAQNVTLTTATSGAAIYYTTNGANPTTSSTPYTGAISISATTTIKAFAVKEDWKNSGVLTAAYTIVLPFASPPELTLEPDNQKIICTWADSEPAADTYDIYWKAGNLSASEVKATGAKITGAANGREITGLANGTTYSVIVTANKAGYTSADSVVETAIPAAVYRVTGSGATFTATKNGAAFGTANQPIQTVIDAIRSDANGLACIIHFGDGDPLDIGTGSASFSGAWGLVELTGKITSANTTATSGTIAIADSVSVTSDADIANTAASADARAIYNNSTGVLHIAGGTVQADTGVAAYNASTGKITVSGMAKVTSANVTAASGTVYLAGTGDQLAIEGGTVENTASNANARAIYNNSTGNVTISGGTVSANTGRAVHNASTGKITVSGTAKVTSANVTTTSGTVYLAGTSDQLAIEGGTVENTADNANARAVYNASTGSVTISGGAVSATTGRAMYNYSTGALAISGGTVSATTGSAVYNDNSGTVTISGGTISATAGYAVYTYSGAVTISGGTISTTTGRAVSSGYPTGKITVSGTAKVTSENVTTGQGTIFINDNTTVAVRLEILGGTVENTANSINARAVYNGSAGIVNISGGTVSATTGRAVQNNSLGTINISGGTVSATTGYGVYNNNTGKITVSGTAKVTTANTSTNQGTIYISNFGTGGDRLSIEGGMVENTSTTGYAIQNVSTGAVNITGGTVSVTGASGYALYNYNTGAVNITGGEVKATTGVAVYNKDTGKITVSGAATKITSANVATSGARGTIYLAATTGDNVWLEIQSGTVENTGTNGYAIYNNSNSPARVTIDSSAVITGQKYGCP